MEDLLKVSNLNTEFKSDYGSKPALNNISFNIKEVEVLYWVGCAGAYDPRNQGIAKSIIKILKSADVDFAVLGKEESCSGDSARRLGEEYLFET